MHVVRAASMASLSMRSSKNSMSSGHSSSTSLKMRLQERLGEVHVVVEVVEGHLRLDHPELGEVPRLVFEFSARKVGPNV